MTDNKHRRNISGRAYELPPGVQPEGKRLRDSKTVIAAFLAGLLGLLQWVFGFEVVVEFLADHPRLLGAAVSVSAAISFVLRLLTTQPIKPPGE